MAECRAPVAPGAVGGQTHQFFAFGAAQAFFARRWVALVTHVLCYPVSNALGRWPEFTAIAALAFLPARASSMICCRNCTGYSEAVFGHFGLHNIGVSAKRGNFRSTI